MEGKSVKTELSPCRSNDVKEDSLDRLLDKIGMGRWQTLIFSVNILIWSAMSPHTTGTTLLNPPVTFICVASMENGTNVPGNIVPDCSNASIPELNFNGHCLAGDQINRTKEASSCPQNEIPNTPWKKTDLDSCPWVLYDQSVFTDTISTEWNFICESSLKRSLFQNADTFGNIIGCLLAGSIGDYFGRARAILIGSVAHVISVGTVAMSGNFSAVFCARIFAGISNLVILINAVTHAVETCPASWRGPVGMLVGLPYSLWTIVFAGMGYFIRSWRYLYMSVTLHAMILLIPISLLLDESPRWLMQKRLKGKAVDVLWKASKMNGSHLNKEEIDNCLELMLQETPIPRRKSSIVDALLMTTSRRPSLTSSDPSTVAPLQRKPSVSPSAASASVSISQENCSSTRRASAGNNSNAGRRFAIGNIRSYFVASTKSLLRYGLDDLKSFLGTPYMRRICLVAPVTRCLGELVYFGIIFNASNFSSSNPFIYVALTGVTDSLAIAVGIPASKYLSRKLTVGGGQLASGFLTLLILGLPKEYKALQLVAIMTGFLMVAVASQAFYVYLPELFPTTLRVRGFALCNLMGQVGLLIAPFICDNLAARYWWAVGVTLGTSGLVAGAFVLFLPETKDLPLCETVQDIERRKLGGPLLNFRKYQKRGTDIEKDATIT